MRNRTVRVAVAACAAALMGTGLAACGGGSGSGQTRITIATFADFGYEDLFAEYEKAHPGVKLENRKLEFDAHHSQLATQLAGGKGAADVVAVEEGWLPKFRGSKDKFVNLADFGAKDLSGQWLDWKWNQGVTDNGSYVLGVGTDVGSLAVCYRKDLFQQAGLPTERAEVSKLWPTWEDYARTADRFAERKPEVKFVSAAEQVFLAMLNQAGEGFFAKADDSFIADTNPKVRAAFDLSAGLAAKGRTSGVKPFSQQWTVGLKQGGFATEVCPAWALAQIAEGAGEGAKGKWDVASVPGNGGNWGGSFLMVPKQGKNIQAAAEVAKWLTAPEQQKKIFDKTGNLPSQPSVLRDATVQGKANEYFSGAPVGQIFASSAESLKPNYRGTQDSLVRPKFQEALLRVEQGKQQPPEALAQALSQSRAELK
ncbi:extracellular solute-binding protein [Allokutzneria multivorans]|uniref:Extracellular solute-binding protein n=1 Tax=Allokutzneria multivorans TaxID=1142134 RepID=A0ABP7SPC2_9PSEU